jgi:hypothetical protein
MNYLYFLKITSAQFAEVVIWTAVSLLKQDGTRLVTCNMITKSQAYVNVHALTSACTSYSFCRKKEPTTNSAELESRVLVLGAFPSRQKREEAGMAYNVRRW